MLISWVWFRSSRFPLPGSLVPLFLAGCVVDSSDKQTTADTTRAGPVVTVTPVNTGSGGMRETIRWILSPDRHALLVVDDPVGIENDPIPNAFFFGDEAREFQVQMYSVWDVVPWPVCKLLAFGMAYTIQYGLDHADMQLLLEVS